MTFLCLYSFTSNFTVCLPEARVHFQHSAELLSRLVKVEANYSLQLYPDEGHVLRDPRSIQHFQRTVVNYLQTCLKNSILIDPMEDEEEEDNWAQKGLKSKRLYAILCITLGWIIWHKRTGVGTKHIRSPPTTKNWCMVYLVAHDYFRCYTVCLRPPFVYTIHLRWCGPEGHWCAKKFTEILKHACRNGCMTWISLHLHLLCFCRSKSHPSGFENAKSANSWEHTRTLKTSLWPIKNKIHLMTA